MNKTFENKKTCISNSALFPLFFGDFLVVFLDFLLKLKISQKVLTERSHQKMKLI